ncbi:hypothetical protein BDD12DRAFT_134309 [Trichophaea hybrida]|nr:hypothetical protein BDD12DRAFT_134309 [Trichophaea hybrida]
MVAATNERFTAAHSHNTMMGLAGVSSSLEAAVTDALVEYIYLPISVASGVTVFRELNCPILAPSAMKRERITHISLYYFKLQKLRRNKHLGRSKGLEKTVRYCDKPRIYSSSERGRDDRQPSHNLPTTFYCCSLNFIYTHLSSSPSLQLAPLPPSPLPTNLFFHSVGILPRCLPFIPPRDFRSSFFLYLVV